MFTGFTDKHFDAYQPSKWRSKAFNLERMAAKDALLELGRELGKQLDTSDAAPLSCEVSVEHPALSNQRQVDSQQLFFARPPEERRALDRILDRSRGMASLLEDPSPQRSHVFLTVELRVDHLFAGLKLHRDATIDRRNLEQQLAGSEHARALLAALAGLPAEIHLGIDGHGTPASQCSREALQELLAGLAGPLLPGQSRWLTVGQRMDRADAIALRSDTGAVLAALLGSLLPLYRLIAWSRDNDHIGMRDQLVASTP